MHGWCKTVLVIFEPSFGECQAALSDRRQIAVHHMATMERKTWKEHVFIYDSTLFVGQYGLN